MHISKKNQVELNATLTMPKALLLVQYIETRWNSTYLPALRGLQQQILYR